MAAYIHLGNHDITLDTRFYAEHGRHFHNQQPQRPEDSIDLLRSSPSITYLDHESRTVRLTKPDGPRTTFNIFGSPYSPARGLWAFGYDSEEQASRLWDQIPADTDVLLTHTPPKYHCDESRDRGAAGCGILRETLWRVRPRLAVCGHIHEARGAENISWDLEDPTVKHKERGTDYWIDPGENNKKQSLIDLTRRRDFSHAHNWEVRRRSEKPMPVAIQERRVTPLRRVPDQRTVPSATSESCETQLDASRDRLEHDSFKTAMSWTDREGTGSTFLHQQDLHPKIRSSPSWD